MSEVSLVDDRNRELYLDWCWETSVELRRTQAVCDRLRRIYYLADNTIFRIIRDDKKKWKPDTTALTSNQVYSWKIFKVIRDTYMGGHECYNVVVGDRQIAEFRTLTEAKHYINVKAKLIQGRLDLLKLYE